MLTPKQQLFLNIVMKLEVAKDTSPQDVPYYQIMLTVLHGIMSDSESAAILPYLYGNILPIEVMNNIDRGVVH